MSSSSMAERSLRSSGGTEANKRMADLIVDRMAASYSAHCDSNEAFVYR